MEQDFCFCFQRKLKFSWNS